MTEPANEPRPKGRVLLGLSTLFALLAGATYIMDADVVSFFLPVRWVVPQLFGLSALLAVFAMIRRRGSRFGLVLLWVSLGAAAAVYVVEFRAYQEVEVAFENQGVSLSGTLYLPKSGGPFTTVVVAPGSIKAPRRLYHFWADALVREGIAVLNVDKRGTGKSGGTYQSDNNASETNLRLLASDVATAAEFAAGRSEVDASRVGILGFSMGGWLAALAASESSQVRFIVAVSGPTVSVGEENYFSSLTGDGFGKLGSAELAEANRATMSRTPSGFDPRQALGNFDIPSLWLFGDLDSSIPVEKSIGVLDSLSGASGGLFDYKVFPGAEHLGFVIGYPFDLVPGFMSEIVEWTRAR
jgi:uncharacterized protein